MDIREGKRNADAVARPPDEELMQARFRRGKKYRQDRSPNPSLGAEHPQQLVYFRNSLISSYPIGHHTQPSMLFV